MFLAWGLLIFTDLFSVKAVLYSVPRFSFHASSVFSCLVSSFLSVCDSASCPVLSLLIVDICVPTCFPSLVMGKARLRETLNSISTVTPAGPLCYRHISICFCETTTQANPARFQTKLLYQTFSNWSSRFGEISPKTRGKKNLRLLNTAICDCSHQQNSPSVNVRVLHHKSIH